MRASGGVRLEWDEVPAEVRTAVEAALGAPVVEARNQAGGFSPGLAARCRLADGRRAFVKAVSPAQNAHTPRIHRREAEVAVALPPDVPAPRLRHVHDDGTWVALAFDEVDGRQPAEPWTWTDLDVVVPALLALGTHLAPTELQPVADRQDAAFRGWRRLASGDGELDRLDDWSRSRLAPLAAIEERWADAAAGSALVHADVRADNILVGPDGAVTFVDWPWACQGAAFLDVAFFLPSVALGGGPRPADVVARYGLFADVDPDRLRAVVVALAGFFVRSALDPPPPGLPRIREFQRAQADVALEWLRDLGGVSP